MTALSFFFYLPTLGLYFAADDFFYVNFSSLREVLVIHADLYHYNPVFWLTMYTLKRIFGTNASVFHLFALLLHIGNIFLVYLLADRFLKKKLQAAVASFLFAFFFANYESVFWITGINTSLMVFFYQLGLLAITGQSGKIARIRYLLFFLLFVLAFFTHEYSISLPITVCIYLISVRRKINVKTAAGLLVPTFLFVFAVFILKIVYGQASLTPASPAIPRIIQSIVKGSLYLFIPIAQLTDNLPRFLLPILFLAVISCLFYQSRRNNIRLFLLFWTLTTVVIFSLTSLPQARYFYLAAIPATMLTASIFTPNSFKPNIINISKFFYLTVIVLCALLFLRKQLGYWQESSRIISSSIDYVRKNSGEQQQSIYFVNLPDSINGPPWNAYLFRSNVDKAFGINPAKIHFVRTVPEDQIIRNDPYVNKSRLSELKNKGILIFSFNRQAKRLEAE